MLKTAVLALVVGFAGVVGVTARPPQASGSRTQPRTAMAVRSAAGLATDLSASSNAEGEEESDHETLFKVINFVILAGALAYLLRKPLATVFTARSESIRKSLEEGRKALEASQAQLQAVERKLEGLEEEIARFKADSAAEMEVERERLRQAAAVEAERILEFARAQIDSAIRAAKLELKSYAARQAVDLAEQTIRRRLGEAGRAELVEQFVRQLSQKPN